MKNLRLVCHTSARPGSRCNHGGIGCPIHHQDGRYDHAKCAEGYALAVEDDSPRGYHLMFSGKDPLGDVSILHFNGRTA